MSNNLALVIIYDLFIRYRSRDHAYVTRNKLGKCFKMGEVDHIFAILIIERCGQ